MQPAALLIGWHSAYSDWSIDTLATSTSDLLDDEFAWNILWCQYLPTPLPNIFWTNPCVWITIYLGGEHLQILCGDNYNKLYSLTLFDCIPITFSHRGWGFGVGICTVLYSHCAGAVITIPTLLMFTSYILESRAASQSAHLLHLSQPIRA